MIIKFIQKNFSWGRLTLFLFLFFLLANLLILDINLFTQEKEESFLAPLKESQPPPAPLASPLATGDLCPPACLEAIAESTTGGITQTVPLPTTIISPTVKEFYIPLGAGSTKSQDWEEISGVEAVIDLANYPKIKSIIFEASMRIPTANGMVHAKLYNVTDQHDVWYSEVSSEGPIIKREESKNISLSSGRKLYRVKMKSTMGYEAILDSARIKILLE